MYNVFKNLCVKEPNPFYDVNRNPKPLGPSQAHLQRSVQVSVHSKYKIQNTLQYIFKIKKKAECTFP